MDIFWVKILAVLDDNYTALTVRFLNVLSFALICSRAPSHSSIPGTTVKCECYISIPGVVYCTCTNHRTALSNDMPFLLFMCIVVLLPQLLEHMKILS